MSAGRINADYIPDELLGFLFPKKNASSQIKLTRLQKNLTVGERHPLGELSTKSYPGIISSVDKQIIPFMFPHRQACEVPLLQTSSFTVSSLVSWQTVNASEQISSAFPACHEINWRYRNKSHIGSVTQTLLLLRLTSINPFHVCLSYTHHWIKSVMKSVQTFGLQSDWCNLQLRLSVAEQQNNFGWEQTGKVSSSTSCSEGSYLSRSGCSMLFAAKL